MIRRTPPFLTPTANIPHALSTAAGLEPYSGPWDRQRAAHLVRRSSFGAIKREVDRALNDGSATATVSRLIATAQSDPLPEAPSWYSRSGSTGTDEIYDLQRTWLEAMRSKGLIEKMTLFWHHHFVTQWTANAGKASNSVGHLTYDYYKLLRFHALGNFRTMVYNVGLNPAMLIYLDGFVNEKGQANENYGRELLELFTMSQYAPDGNENYTEQDIKEVARALTGWVVTSGNRASFDPARHDRSTKTIMGRTDLFDYDGVIDLIFDIRAPQIAHYICRKLYCFFVRAMPDEGLVADLAQVFLASNFEIAPVIKALLTSEHFYDDSFIAGRIKSPVELLVGFLREAEMTPNRDLLDNLREILSPMALNQELFNPPNVAGWPGLNPPGADGRPGHYTWLSTSTLPDRWDTLERFLSGTNGNNYDPFTLVQKISDPSDPFRLPTDLAEMMIPVPLDEAGIFDVEENFGGDPAFPPPSEFLGGPKHAVNLAKILLNGSPHYEWPRFTDQNPENEEEARENLLRFLSYLIQLPEYQLT